MVLLLLLCCVFMTARCTDVLKCCPRGEKYREGGCAPTDEPWTPLIYSERRREYLPFGATPAHWTLVAGSAPACRPGQAELRVRASPQAPAFVLFENGSLLLIGSGELVAPGRYCADHTEAVACVGAGAAADPAAAAAMKCCGPAARFSEAASACEMVEGDPPLPGVDAVGFPACRDGEELGVVARVGAAGAARPGGGVGPGEFCVERLLEGGVDEVSVFACHVPAASPPVLKDSSDLRFVLYPVGLFLSCFFLACTLAAGCLLPASHHLLHWRCQTYHVACLLVGDLLLAVTHLSGHKITGPLCLVLATLTHFVFLAAFFWLNTMCFNIWWTFRDLRPANMDKGQEFRRLRAYQVYAWGFPVFIACLAIFMDNLPESYSSVLRPRFGYHNCWFYGDKEILAYFYAPVGVLLLLNLLLFAATARELTCGLWRGDVNSSSSERSTLGRVCLKLVIVMGLTWLVDVISWAVGGPSYLWYFPDIINTLQGVFIFAVVGCHPQVWGAVKRLWCLKERCETTRMANHLSSCSHASRSIGELTSNTTKTMPLETLC